MTNEKRTIDAQIARPAAQPDLPCIPPQGWGVGNAPPPPSRLGGGYLSICMPSEFSVPAEKKFSDPRIEQLEDMGLRRTFIDVAEAIGFDAFMTMWRIFSADESFRDQGPSAMRIVMRPFSAWERYQRNKYIEHLMASGLSDREVMDRLARQCGIECDDGLLWRLREQPPKRDKRHKKNVAHRRGKR